MDQHSLFEAVSGLPTGMAYVPGFISPADEQQLLKDIAGLPFQNAAYKEWTARRRVVGYGGRYDYTRNELHAAEAIPALLHPLRERIAIWSGIPSAQFMHALVAEYAPGVQLGWHRDVPDYETIVGISLGSTGRMRLRPYPPQAGRGRATLAIDLAPRSVYILQGAARWDWQHAISPTPALRYSVTFRTLAR